MDLTRHISSSYTACIATAHTASECRERRDCLRQRCERHRRRERKRESTTSVRIVLDNVTNDKESEASCVTANAGSEGEVNCEVSDGHSDLMSQRNEVG